MSLWESFLNLFDGVSILKYTVLFTFLTSPLHKVMDGSKFQKQQMLLPRTLSGVIDLTIGESEKKPHVHWPDLKRQ